MTPVFCFNLHNSKNIIIYQHTTSFQDGLSVFFTDTSFSVACVMADIDAYEAHQWREGDMQYGFFKHGNIPFFLLDGVLGLTLSAGMNICALKPRKMISWFEQQDTQVALLLIESRTQQVIAERKLYIQREFMCEFRKYLHGQYRRYGYKQVIDEKINTTAEKYAVDHMLKIAESFKSIWQIP